MKTLNFGMFWKRLTLGKKFDKKEKNRIKLVEKLFSTLINRFLTDIL